MKAISFLTITLLILLTAFLSIPRAAGQVLTSPWSEPVNLSNSGAAADPMMVADVGGSIHVFWKDEFDGTVYTRGDGETWESPVPVSPPFADYTPTLAADSIGYLHAFWSDESQALYYASVPANEVADNSWSAVEVLAGSAVVIDVEIDAQDRFHLAYLRVVSTFEAPSGVYYRQSAPGGNSWSDSALLYRSPYYRKLAAGDGHVELEITEVDDIQHVYVTWDNPLRGKVFLAKSADAGNEWGEPVEVDKPEDVGGGDSRPSNPGIYAQGEDVLLVWQTGSAETGCAQYYQWSLDGGEFWQPRQRLATTAFGCPEETKIFRGASGPIISTLNSTQVYLQAWDGSRWSIAQLQNTLSSFTDPETQQNVTLGCHQTALVEGYGLIIAGCGTGESTDVWWLRRNLDDVDEWFPQESLWQPLTSITNAKSEFLSIALAVDTAGRVHVFWAQNSDPASQRADSSIYYTRWEGERLWFQPVAILNSPEQPADQPAVAIGSAERLLIAWRCGEQAEICFSQASANLAALADAWTEPVRVSKPGQMTSAPDIRMSSSGEIFITYTVPVNEGRGVYITDSKDGGRTWSDPVLVFDGAKAGWTMLDHPRLALTDTNDLHLLWSQYTLVSGLPEPLALAYAYSSDGGESWSEPEIVTENPVLWSQILGIGKDSVQRLWREVSGGSLTLWHELSPDNGVNWARIAQISVFGQAIGNPSLAWDKAGKMHLFQVVDRGTGDYVLQHWMWDGERWGSEYGPDLDLEAGTSVGILTSALSEQGNLAVILSGRIEELASVFQETLFFTERSIELQAGLATPLPLIAVTPLPSIQPTPEPSLAPTSTSTPDLSALSGSGASGNTGSAWSGLVIGAGLAGMIVAVAFGFWVWKAKAAP